MSQNLPYIEVMFFIMMAFYIAIGIGLWELIWWALS